MHVWPLIALTLLCQAAWGLVALAWGSMIETRDAAENAGLSLPLLHAAWIALSLGLVASSAHLGRPRRAVRALTHWRRSWLSREVLALTVFWFLLSAIIAGVRMGAPSWLYRAATHAAAVTGLLAVYAMSRVYRVPSAVPWDTRRTTLLFFNSAALLGLNSAMLLASFGIDVPLRLGIHVEHWLLALLVTHAILAWSPHSPSLRNRTMPSGTNRPSSHIQYVSLGFAMAAWMLMMGMLLWKPEPDIRSVLTVGLLVFGAEIGARFHFFSRYPRKRL